MMTYTFLLRWGWGDEQNVYGCVRVFTQWIFFALRERKWNYSKVTPLAFNVYDVIITRIKGIPFATATVILPGGVIKTEHTKPSWARAYGETSKHTHTHCNQTMLERDRKFVLNLKRSDRVIHTHTHTRACRHSYGTIAHTHTHTCSETLKDTINRPALMWCCVVLALGYKALPERKRER